jgi:L-threonylcarbamoyladenylate synthase
MSISPVLDIDSPKAINESLRVLSNGGIFIFPTDTVYGIGCSAFHSQAIERIFITKGRDFNKALPILIGSHEQLTMIAESINPIAKKLMQTFWPGPLTIIVCKNPLLPKKLTSSDTVGIRMPNHPWLLNLIKISGPLASTSANPSGKLEARNVNEVLITLDGKIDLIIDGGQCSSALPSTVVDCHGTEIKILREGPISAGEIFAVLQ